MDQGEFSNSVGITHTSYRHIESGKLELTIQEAKKIEKKYEIVLTEFIEDPEEDEYEQYLSSKGSGATLGDVYIKKKK
jgi:ribosome-binding protein aMBF1 (putative translation factor)